MGVWERAPKTKRLHFHGLFYIPEGTMPGEMIEKKDFNLNTHKMQLTLQSEYFNSRFGRNDFERIDDNLVKIGNAMAYILKYIGKTNEKIVYSRKLPVYVISDIDEKDVLKKMKEFQKGILDNDRVISAENVQRMGEVIALCAIKTVIVRGGKDLHNLYKGLLHDVNRSENDMSRYSDGYDIAQEAMLFLCQHMGKRLDDVYYTKTGRKTTIKQACFSVADRYLAKNFVSPMLNTTSLNEQIMTEPEAILDDEQKNDYAVFDSLISKMHLTAVE